MVEHEVTGANILAVRVETNCPKGGDSGHGGRTVFELEDVASSDITVTPIAGAHGGAGGVRIELGGDSECETFTQALRWAAIELERQAGTPRDGAAISASSSAGLYRPAPWRTDADGHIRDSSGSLVCSFHTRSSLKHRDHRCFDFPHARPLVTAAPLLWNALRDLLLACDAHPSASSPAAQAARALLRQIEERQVAEVIRALRSIEPKGGNAFGDWASEATAFSRSAATWEAITVESVVALLPTVYAALESQQHSLSGIVHEAIGLRLQVLWLAHVERLTGGSLPKDHESRQFTFEASAWSLF